MKKQKDRLVELIGEELLNYSSWSTEMALQGTYEMPSAEEVIADKLLADGWMRPPCQVGQEVYWYDSTIHSKPYPMTVAGIADHGEGHMWVYCKNGTDHRQFRVCSFGKTIFLTKEEAEQALKGGAE